MSSFKEIYFYFSLLLMIIVSFSSSVFYLSVIPTVTQLFEAHRFDSQLAYPCCMLGATIAFLFIGPLCDIYGAKKVIIMQLISLLVGSLLCLFAIGMFSFLSGVVFIGLSNYYTSFVKLLKSIKPDSAVSMLSRFTIVAFLFIPVNVAIAGHLVIIEWHWVFLYWTILTLICIALAYYVLPSQKEPSSRFELSKYMENMKYFFKNFNFNTSLILFSGFMAVQSIFYTLSPHIIITDFKLSPSTYGYLLFIPTLGIVVGNSCVIYFNRYFNPSRSILLGELIALSGILMLIIITFFYPSAYVLMICFAVFRLGYPLVTNHLTMNVMNINFSLSGTALAFLYAQLNIVNTASGGFVARQDAEHMGLIMLLVLSLTMIVHYCLNRKIAQ